MATLKSLECWNDGLLEKAYHSIIPIFHSSNNGYSVLRVILIFLECFSKLPNSHPYLSENFFLPLVS